MALYNTVAEYTTAIANVQAAIDRSLGIGSSGSTTVAGNVRQFAEVSFAQLNRYKAQLIKERNLLYGKPFKPKADW